MDFLFVCILIKAASAMMAAPNIIFILAGECK